ncbi:MAG: EAL domain-containing protein [Delftia acidovorans]|nr:EAL domain-containing protein [Delftia acidovorans]
MRNTQAATNDWDSSQKCGLSLLNQQLIDVRQELDDLKTALNAHAIVAVTDARGVITQVNETFCQISRYAQHELIGRTHRIINSGQHSKAFFLNLWTTISSGEVWHGEICNRAKDGSLYWMHTTIVPFIGTTGRPERYIAIQADITQRKQAEQQVSHLALHDALTGLPNRVLLAERLQQTMAAIGRNRRFGALMLLDLDNFKDINDRLGHSLGDELLRQVAHRLHHCVCASDTVARVGGDEFVILLNDLDADPGQARVRAHAMAERIQQALASGFNLSGQQVHSSSSIGLLLMGDAEQEQEELMRLADMALYKAKARGRNNVYAFDPQLQAEAQDRASLASDLREALSHEDIGLHLLFQPVVDLLQRPLGWEALLRWQHPTKGLLTPDAFIEQAEQTGLAFPLGQWVLQAACRQLAQWSHVPGAAHWSLAVNVSTRQFQDPLFVSSVQSALESTGASPDLLRLELAESMFLMDIESSILKMQELQALGVRFALDDLGTGYSSLACLQRLPLNQLKVDHSFVQGLPGDPGNAAITATILALARALNLKVVAEGVENAAQLGFLRQQGCDAFQGHLFGKPMPASETERHFMRPKP